MQLTRKKKLELMKNLNWNFYKDTPEDMLAVIEGKKEKSGGFDRKSLFVQSLERLPWHIIIALWGIEAMKELYTPELKRRIRPQLRGIHDFAFSILRGEPVSASGWGVVSYRSKRHRFFSNRGNCA
jgi:hypothetical protein